MRLFMLVVLFLYTCSMERVCGFIYTNPHVLRQSSFTKHTLVPKVRLHHSPTTILKSSTSSGSSTTTTNSAVEEFTENMKKNQLQDAIKVYQDMDLNSVINSLLLGGVALAVLIKVGTVDAGILRGWTAEEIAVRIPLDNWESYGAVLREAPLMTKAVTSATVYAIGDMISQSTEGCTIGKLDRPRVLRSLLAGFIGHGPLSHVWYDWSEDIFENTLHWTQWWSFFPKVLVDQATWGPFWNNVYILLLGVMKLDSPMTIWLEMKRTTIPLIVSGLKLWPLAHCITYGLVPVENRLLWVDLVEIIWVTILASAASGQAEDTVSNEAFIERKEDDATLSVDK